MPGRAGACRPRVTGATPGPGPGYESGRASREARPTALPPLKAARPAQFAGGKIVAQSSFMLITFQPFEVA